MRVVPLVASLLIAIAAPLAKGADLQFRDGRVWSAVRVLHRDATYVLVMHEKGIYTVHAEELTEEGVERLGIRLPTPEEIAEREAAEARVRRTHASPRDEKERNGAKPASRQVRPSAAPVEVKEAEAPSGATPNVVQEFSSVLAPTETHPVVQLYGRVLARLARGAIVQADGMPPDRAHGDAGWVFGTIYLQEDGRLRSVYRGAPVSGRVSPAGEHRYFDSAGTEHVLAAWRLE